MGTEKKSRCLLYEKLKSGRRQVQDITLFPHQPTNPADLPPNQPSISLPQLLKLLRLLKTSPQCLTGLHNQKIQKQHRSRYRMVIVGLSPAGIEQQIRLGKLLPC